jgi:predicted nucleic acid-binding protein
MRVLLDSDVVVAALERGHVHHERARSWFEQMTKDEMEVVVAGTRSCRYFES